MKPSQLRQLILDNGEELVQQYIDAALGKGGFTATNLSAREEMWDMLKSMMLKSSDTVDALDVQEARNILDHVASGKLTLAEGDKLLAMFKTVAEIERPTIDAGGTSVTVVIQSADKQETKVITPNVLEHDDGQD